MVSAAASGRRSALRGEAGAAPAQAAVAAAAASGRGGEQEAAARSSSGQESTSDDDLFVSFRSQVREGTHNAGEEGMRTRFFLCFFFWPPSVLVLVESGGFVWG